MHETYRMLGREHEADLAREAAQRGLAAEARGCRRSASISRAAVGRSPWTRRLARHRILAFLIGHVRA
jgi:hypothetical protein